MSTKKTVINFIDEEEFDFEDVQQISKKTKIDLNEPQYKTKYSKAEKNSFSTNPTPSERQDFSLKIHKMNHINDYPYNYEYPSLDFNENTDESSYMSFEIVNEK